MNYFYRENFPIYGSRIYTKFYSPSRHTKNWWSLFSPNLIYLVWQKLQAHIIAHNTTGLWGTFYYHCNLMHRITCLTPVRSWTLNHEPWVSHMCHVLPKLDRDTNRGADFQAWHHEPAIHSQKETPCQLLAPHLACHPAPLNPIVLPALPTDPFVYQRIQHGSSASLLIHWSLLGRCKVMDSEPWTLS